MQRTERIIGDTEYIAVFSDDGELQEEAFSSGQLALFRVKVDSGIEETYLCAGKVLTAKQYENARVGYAGMPEADPARDVLGDFIEDLGFACSFGSSESAGDRDARKIFSESSDLSSFFARKGSLFGETYEDTVALCQSLVRAGARIAVDMRDPISGTATPCVATGLVVRLPEDTSDRTQILTLLKPYADRSGYPLQVESGDEYIYILDS